MPSIYRVGLGPTATNISGGMGSYTFLETFDIHDGQQNALEPYVQIHTDVGSDWVQRFDISCSYRTIPKGTTGGWGTWSSFVWSGVPANQAHMQADSLHGGYTWATPLKDIGSAPVGTDPFDSIGKLVCPNGWSFAARGNDAMQFQVHVRIIYVNGKTDQFGNSKSALYEADELYVYYIPHYSLTSIALESDGLDIRYSARDWGRPDDRWGFSSLTQDGENLVTPNNSYQLTYGQVDAPGRIHIPATALTKLPDGGTVSVRIRMVAGFAPQGYDWGTMSGTLTMPSVFDCNTPTLRLSSASAGSIVVKVGDAGDKGAPIQLVYLRIVGYTDVTTAEPGGQATIMLPPIGKVLDIQAWGVSETGAASDIVALLLPPISGAGVPEGIMIAPEDGGSGVEVLYNASVKWSFEPVMELRKYYGRERESSAFGVGGKVTGTVECDIIDADFATGGAVNVSQTREAFEELCFRGPCILRDDNGDRRRVAVTGVDESYEITRLRKRMTISVTEVS